MHVLGASEELTMGLETVTEIIDDVEVTITKYAFTRGQKVSSWLLSLLVPALGEAAEVAPALLNGKVEDLLKYELKQIVPAIHRLASAASDNTERLWLDVLAGTSVIIHDGDKTTKIDLTSSAMIDRAFNDREATARKVWWASFKVQFRPFGFDLAVLAARTPRT